jgi:hypothetical protein
VKREVLTGVHQAHHGLGGRTPIENTASGGTVFRAKRRAALLRARRQRFWKPVYGQRVRALDNRAGWNIAHTNVSVLVDVSIAFLTNSSKN